MRPGLRPFVVALALLAVGARYGLAQNDVLSKYQIQPEAWRPVQTVEPGVNANGDLTMSIPLLTVPGRGGLDYPITLTYRSGVTLQQTSTWVGLGWGFDPGSITRDVQTVVMDYGEGGQQVQHNADYTGVPTYQPDQYFVTTPWMSATMFRQTGAGQGDWRLLMTELSTGCLNGTNPFVLEEWRAWKLACTTTASGEQVGGKSLGVDGYTSAGVPEWRPMQDFKTFTVTDENGTRYVFAHPSLGFFEGFTPGYSSRTKEHYVSTWRLVAVLSRDFVGDPLNPAASSRGNWIKLTYGPVRTTSMYHDFGTTGFMQAARLTSIETPTHRATFVADDRFPEVTPKRGAEVVGTDDVQSVLREVALCAKVDESTCTPVKTAVLSANEVSIGHDGTRSVKRVVLDSLAYVGSDNSRLPGYAFTYHWPNGRGADAFSGADYATRHADDFGYYNTAGGGRLPYSYINEITDDAKAWSLASIRSPTGGKTTVLYENDKVESTASYGTNINGTNGGGSYTVSTNANRQGGPRVTVVVRYRVHTDADAETSTAYTYGQGRLSGVPTGFWSRQYASSVFLRIHDRRGAAVYYTAVTETHSDGTTTQTQYSTDVVQGLPDGPSGAQDFQYTRATPNGSVLFQRRENLTVVQSNRHLTFGWPIRTVTTAGEQRTVTKTYTPTVFGSVRAFHLPTDVWLYFRDANNVRREDASFRGGNTRADYTYTDRNLLRTTTDQATGLPTLVTTRTYAYEIPAYDALKGQNLLSAVVREETYRAGTDNRYESTVATTWKPFAVAGSATEWHPYRTYRSADAAPTLAAPVFSDGWWASPDGPVAAGWRYDASNDQYDAYGHVVLQTDARAGVTRLFYGDNGAPKCGGDPGTCTETGTGLFHAYLTAVERLTGRTTGVTALTWVIGYDRRTGQVASVTDASGAQVFRRFTYDGHGRLAQTSNAANVVLSQHEYRLAGASPLVSTAPNYVRTLRPNDDGTTQATTEFLDGRGRVIQVHERDGTFDVVTATDLDVQGRPSKAWNPARVSNPAHGFVVGHGSLDRDGFNGTAHRPYTEQLYDGQGRPGDLYVQTTTTSRGARRQHRYGTEPATTPAGASLGYLWALDETLDEEGDPVQVARDARGREVLRRQYGTQLAPTGMQGDFTLLADTTCGAGGGALSSASASTTAAPRRPLGAFGPGSKPDKPKKKDGDVTTMDVNQDCQVIKARSFTVPTTMLVRIAYSAERGGTGSTAIVQASGAGPLVDVVLYGSEYYAYDTATFLAVPGTTYTVRVEAKASSYGQGGWARAEAAVTLQENGYVRFPLETRFEHDAVGRVVKVMPPKYFETPAGPTREALATTYTYETDGRLTEKRTPDGGTEKYRYDRGGLLRFVERQSDRNVSVGATKRFLYFKYDVLGREVEAGLYTGPTTFAGADVAADTWPTSGVSERVLKAYDTQPAIAGDGWGHVPLGPGGDVNVKGRLAAVASESGAGSGTGSKWRVERYQYHADHGVPYVVHMRNQDDVSQGNTYEYRYRSLDRQGRTVYWDASRIVSGAHHWVGISYAYNARGLLQTVASSASHATTGVADAGYTYKASGAVATRQFRSQTPVPHAYDVRGRLTAIGDVATTAHPFSAAYGYTASGQIATWEQAQGGAGPATLPNPARYRQAFAYDGAGRLLGADFSPYASGAYQPSSAHDLGGLSYDGNGNLTALVRNGADGLNLDALTYRYVPGTNRLEELLEGGHPTRGASYQWHVQDADGATTYVHGFGPNDERDRDFLLDRRKLPVQTTVDEPYASGRVWSYYRYTASGERYWKQTWAEGNEGAPGELSVLGFAGAAGREPVAGAWGNNGSALKHWNVVAPSGEVLGRILPSGQRRYYAKDHLGSVRAVVDDAGTVTERHDYDAWGALLEGRDVNEAPTASERYTGHQHDAETGLVYAGARYLIPEIGRWLSVDPLADKYPGHSTYSYVLSNPVSFVDPDGREVYISYTGENGEEHRVRYTVGMRYRGGNRFVAQMVNLLNNIGSTRGGQGVLSDLVASDNTYSVTDKASSKKGTFSFQADQRGGGMLRMGGFETLATSHGEAYQTHTVAHELFHAYQSERGGPGRSVNREIEAALFASAVNLALNQQPPVLYAASTSAGQTYSRVTDYLLYEAPRFNVFAMATAVTNWRDGSSAGQHKEVYEGIPDGRVTSRSPLAQFFPLSRW